MTSIVVPSYRRPQALLRCLRSLVEAAPQPDEIIVVGREGDQATKEALAQAEHFCAGKVRLRLGWVTEPGHLPPVEEGLKAASGEIVVFVDDDVTVTADWLHHMTAPFADPSVGVVGGRVVTSPCSQPARLKGKPGCLSWYGRHWGNVTSLEGESPLQVGAVMECNWAWRRVLLASLKFDPILNFDDASMYGLALCLEAKNKDFRVVYEPRAVVYHHPEQRAPGLDRRDRPRRIFAYTRNYTYIMLNYLPWWRRPIFLVWWFLIGERGSCGLAAVVADTIAGRSPQPAEIWSALTGKVRGMLLHSWEERVHGS